MSAVDGVERIAAFRRLDGYPVYARWGYTQAGDAASAVKPLRSSYKLKSGNRFDLRRCNLIVTPRGPGRQRSMQAHAAILFPNDPERQAEWLQAADQRRKAQQEAARLAAEFRGVLPRPVRIVAASAVEG